MPAGPTDCENCKAWSPNTVARVMGWCMKHGGPKPYDPLVVLLDRTGSRAYTDSCPQFVKQEEVA